MSFSSIFFFIFIVLFIKFSIFLLIELLFFIVRKLSLSVLLCILLGLNEFKVTLLFVLKFVEYNEGHLYLVSFIFLEKLVILFTIIFSLF